MFSVGGYQLKPGRHQICRTPFQEFLEREPIVQRMGVQLVSVWDYVRKRFFLGMWANRLTGRFIEIISWKHFEEPSRDDMLTVLFNLDPERRRRHFEAWLRNQEQEERDEMRRTCDEASEEEQIRQHYRRLVNIHHRDDPAFLGIPIATGDV